MLIIGVTLDLVSEKVSKYGWVLYISIVLEVSNNREGGNLAFTFIIR